MLLNGARKRHYPGLWKRWESKEHDYNVEEEGTRKLERERSWFNENCHGANGNSRIGDAIKREKNQEREEEERVEFFREGRRVRPVFRFDRKAM